MSEGVPSIKRIIANTINEKAFGDPDALAGHILDELTENGIWIVPEDTAFGSQPFDELTPEMRPQDPDGKGKGWWFQTSEHGGDEPDNMPQAITARDAEGRWAVYVPLTRGGKIVIPRPATEEDERNTRSMREAERSSAAFTPARGDYPKVRCVYLTRNHKDRGRRG
jgi:hypothetical protein